MPTVHYDLGDKVRIQTAFRNEDSELTDPTAVTVKIKTPAGVTSTYVYGSDDEVVKDSEGTYYLDLSLDAAGIWYWRFYGTGALQAASEGGIHVNRSFFS